jgi:hypothetical protein
MDAGLQKVNRVCDLAEKILPNTSSDGKRIIEQQVTELTNEWEKLNQAISECSTMLEGVHVASSTPHLSRIQTHNFNGDMH